MRNRENTAKTRCNEDGMPPLVRKKAVVGKLLLPVCAMAVKNAGFA